MKYKTEKLQSLLHKLTGEIWKTEQMPSEALEFEVHSPYYTQILC